MSPSKKYNADELEAAFALLELSTSQPIPAATVDRPVETTPVRLKVRHGRPRKGTQVLSKESPQCETNCSSGDVKYALTYCIVSPVMSEKLAQASALENNNHILSLSKGGAKSRDRKYVRYHSNTEATNNVPAVVDEEAIQAAHIFTELQKNWIRSIIC